MRDERLIGARVAGQADLQDVRTAALNAEVIFPPMPGEQLGYELESAFAYAPPEEGSDALVAHGSYTLDAWVQREDDHVSFASISFSLVAIFDLPPAEGANAYEPEEFEAFVNTTAQFALYPYARETVSMLTTRLGVPPLTLGMLRIPLTEDEVGAEG